MNCDNCVTVKCYFNVRRISDFTDIKKNVKENCNTSHNILSKMEKYELSP